MAKGCFQCWCLVVPSSSTTESKIVRGLGTHSQGNRPTRDRGSGTESKKNVGVYIKSTKLFSHCSMPDYRPPPQTKPKSTLTNRPAPCSRVGWIQHKHNTTAAQL